MGTPVVCDSKFHRLISHHWWQYSFYHYLFQIMWPFLVHVMSCLYVLIVPDHIERTKLVALFGLVYGSLGSFFIHLQFLESHARVLPF